ncbi:MAG: hypothetical protein WA761_01280 [Thermoplasmata archaeon]
MRGLTDAEARVIAVLLGALPAPERDRLQRLQIPRSTYHAARRRAYVEGWLRDRYVPDPARFGWPRVTFVIARPFLDRAQDLLRTWQDLEENVYLTGSPQVVLGVFFHTSDKDAKALVERTQAGHQVTWLQSLTADVTEGGVPVYFDYEGLWGHIAALEGTVSYPLGLGGSTSGERVDDGMSASEHQRWAAGELVHRPFVASDSGRSSHLVGPFGLPFSQQKLLRSGWVIHRSFLDASRIPPYKGRATALSVFIWGTLKPGRSPQDLFSILVRECRVFPFLYAIRDAHILIGALGGQASATETSEMALGQRRPVMSTLQEYLEGIEIVQEAAAQLSPQVDHRYERLIPRRST